MGRPSDRISPSVRNLILILSLTVLRCLVILAFGDDLQQRVELSNVFTGFKGIKEASALLHHGVFPYSGSGVRVPPLAISALQTSVGSWWAPWPFIFADMLSACLIFLVVRHLTYAPFGDSKARPEAMQETFGVVTPTMAACMYLCNPLLILTCASLSLAGLVQAALMFAVYGAAVQRSPAIAALGVAIASYLDIYSTVFCLPLSCILLGGVEFVAAMPCSRCLQQANAPSDVAAKLQRQRCFYRKGATESEAAAVGSSNSLHPAYLKFCEFWGILLLYAVALVLLSDVSVLTWPGGRCVEWLQVGLLNRRSPLDEHGQQIRRLYAALNFLKQGLCSVEMKLADYLKKLYLAQGPSLAQPSGHAPGFAIETAYNSWIWQSYGRLIVYDDPSPNIGVWWYFIGEMFQEFKVFFKFVLHSQTLLFSIPIAVRFRHRPLFSFFLHAMLVAIFKPFPVAADVALYVTLLSMLLPVLGWSQPGIVLAFIMQMAAIMGPATLYLWLQTGSANSNFFYAMTLVWAGAQVLIMLLITFAVQQHDIDVSGKAWAFMLPHRAEAMQVGTSRGE